MERERRTTARRSVHLEAVVACPRFGLFRAVVDNASDGGLHLRTPLVSLCIEEPVELTLEDPSGMLAAGRAAGQVVHQDSEGFGVRLVSLDAAGRRLLRTGEAPAARPETLRRCLA